MDRSKYLYHGSGREICGMLIPNKAIDLQDKPENTLNGIYASSLKKEAIIMGLLRCGRG